MFDCFFFNFKDFFYLMYIGICLYVCMSVNRLYALPLKVRKGSIKPWSWLLTALWVLGFEPGPLEEEFRIIAGTGTEGCIEMEIKKIL